MKQSPHLENGYCRFATEWLEAFIRADYPGSVKEFVLAIARETWGWNETWREIPAARLAELLGVTISRVKQLRIDADSWGLICWEPGKGHNSSGRYRVQKDPRDWITKRVNGKWEERHSGQDAVSSEDVLSGERAVSGGGKHGLSSDRIARGVHHIDSSIDTPKTSDSAASADKYDQAYSLYCTALHQKGSNPGTEASFANVVNSYGEDAALHAAVITAQKFANEQDKPNGGSVASYFLQVARTQSEKIEQALRASGADGDPIKADYIRAKGPCPEDAFDRADWHQGLDAYREQRGVA